MELEETSQLTLGDCLSFTTLSWIQKEKVKNINNFQKINKTVTYILEQLRTQPCEGDDQLHSGTP